MSRTLGTMKVAVFEKYASINSAREMMKAYADLLGEAAEWIRGEMVRVNPTPNKRRTYYEIYNVAVNLDVSIDDDENGVTAKLYLHYDDNEKG